MLMKHIIDFKVDLFVKAQKQALALVWSPRAKFRLDNSDVLSYFYFRQRV